MLQSNDYSNLEFIFFVTANRYRSFWRNRFQLIYSYHHLFRNRLRLQFRMGLMEKAAHSARVIKVWPKSNSAISLRMHSKWNGKTQLTQWLSKWNWANRKMIAFKIDEDKAEEFYRAIRLEMIFMAMTSCRQLADWNFGRWFVVYTNRKCGK